jgi:hypothetical protein
LNNILLVGIIANKGYIVVFGANKCWVLNAKQSSKVLATRTKNISNGLYHMQLELQKLVALVMDINSTTIAIIEFWHRSLSHHHYQGLQMLSNLG